MRKFNFIRWAVILIGVYNVVLCVGIAFIKIPIGNRYSFLNWHSIPYQRKGYLYLFFCC